MMTSCWDTERRDRKTASDCLTILLQAQRDYRSMSIASASPYSSPCPSFTSTPSPSSRHLSVILPQYIQEGYTTDSSRHSFDTHTSNGGGGCEHVPSGSSEKKDMVRNSSYRSWLTVGSSRKSSNADTHSSVASASASGTTSAASAVGGATPAAVAVSSTFLRSSSLAYLFGRTTSTPTSSKDSSSSKSSVKSSVRSGKNDKNSSRIKPTTTTATTPAVKPRSPTSEKSFDFSVVYESPAPHLYAPLYAGQNYMSRDNNDTTHTHPLSPLMTTTPVRGLIDTPKPVFKKRFSSTAEVVGGTGERNSTGSSTGGGGGGSAGSPRDWAMSGGHKGASTLLHKKPSLGQLLTGPGATAAAGGNNNNNNNNRLSIRALVTPRSPTPSATEASFDLNNVYPHI